MPETWGGASLSSVNASWLLAEMKERSCPLLAGCVSSVQFSSVQFSSVGQSCLTLCNPIDLEQ